MERQFNNGDFEKLLRDNANQYRMYPSEKVWKGVHSALHTRRKWYGGFTALIIFLITGTAVSIFIINDKPRKENIADQINTAKQSGADQSPVIPGKQKQFTPATGTPSAKIISPVADLNNIYLTHSDQQAPVNNDKTNITASSSNNNIVPSITSNEPEVTEGIHELAEFYTEQLQATANLTLDNNRIATEQTRVADANILAIATGQSAVDENTETKINEAISALASQNAAPVQKNNRSRVTGQLYFTPTISYRKLTENKQVLDASRHPVPVINPDNMVKHKPAMGLEFGFEGRYHLDKTFSIKAGLQFNINRYDISAYSHPTEIATVALSNGLGVDSLAALTNYRNSNSTSANWLENFYFQTSLPVGAEVIIGGSKNVRWGISATIQPTYTIGDRAYVISSDFKNYAKFPDLMRRWNISTGVDAFVSYSTGRIRWQAGPHVRYQHLSSFVSALTIKEKLYAIGFRIGATIEKHK